MMEPCSALQLGCDKGIIGHVLNFFVASIILAWVDILYVKQCPVICRSSEWTDLVVLSGLLIVKMSYVKCKCT